MAQTIQIRRGTGSAVPSSLAEGELAINVDTGKLYFGQTSTSASSNFRFENLTAENYTVTSSVTHYSFQTLSGSTNFGDDLADIQNIIETTESQSPQSLYATFERPTPKS